MGVVNDQIAFMDPENMADRVSAALWLSDGTSFEGLGATGGISLQKQINKLENMAMDAELRSTRGVIAYNPNAVDGANLEGQNTNIARS